MHYRSMEVVWKLTWERGCWKVWSFCHVARLTCFRRTKRTLSYKEFISIQNANSQWQQRCLLSHELDHEYIRFRQCCELSSANANASIGKVVRWTHTNFSQNFLWRNVWPAGIAGNNKDLVPGNSSKSNSRLVDPNIWSVGNRFSTRIVAAIPVSISLQRSTSQLLQQFSGKESKQPWLDSWLGTLRYRYPCTLLQRY